MSKKEKRQQQQKKEEKTEQTIEKAFEKKQVETTTGKTEKKESPKFEKAATVLITEIGSDGTRFLTIQVMNKDGNPDPGATVRILDDDHPKKYYDLHPTDKNGITECKIEFAKEKRICILVLGTKIFPRWMNFRNKNYKQPASESGEQEIKNG